MSLDYFCVSMDFLPDTPDGCINSAIFLLLLMGFSFIVLGSKKYSHLMEYFERKFGDWY